MKVTMNRAKLRGDFESRDEAKKQKKLREGVIIRVIGDGDYDIKNADGGEDFLLNNGLGAFSRGSGLSGRSLGRYTDFICSSVEGMKIGVTVGGSDITPSMIEDNDINVETQGYYGGWAAHNTPSGGAKYILTTLQRVRDIKKDQTWSPDGYGDHYLFGGNVYVAMATYSTTHVRQFGAIDDYNEVLDTGTDNTPSFLSWLASDSKCLSFSGGGKYKVFGELYSTEPKIIVGYGSFLFQRDITAPLFNLNTMSGSEFHGGDYSHNMDISNYDINNGRLFYANTYVTDITLYHVRIYKTAQQGFDIDNGGDNIKILMCEFENTARDGCFFVNVTNAKVSLSNFKNTGDDSIAFARQSLDHICTSNTIEGAGSYNLGGSGIRSNSRGIISGNSIVGSDLFGIIAAVNDSFQEEKPHRLVISDNVITGITKTGTVTAGIGFKQVESVECINNQILMDSKEAHAYRIYGAGEQSNNISIQGGTVENAKSIIYIRDSGVKILTIGKYLKCKDCIDPVLIEATGSVDSITLDSVWVANIQNANLLHISSTNTATIGSIETKNNRISNANNVNFRYEDNVFVSHVSINDQYPTGIYADYSGVANAGERVIDGRYGDKCEDNGSVTFNATDSGLIGISLSPNIIPQAHELSIIMRTSLGDATNWYVDFVDGVNFRVALNTPPAQNVTFDWSVKAYNKRCIK